MKRKTFLLLLLLSIIFACSSNNEITDNEEKPKEEKEDTDNPDTDSPDKAKTDISFTPYANSGNQEMDFFKYWGTGQKDQDDAIGRSLSTDYPVIDNERFATDHSDYITIKPLFSSESHLFSEADPLTYLEATSFTGKGLHVLLPPGKLNQSGRVFAEITNKRLEASYNFLSLSNMQKEISTDYLHPDFIRKLYTSSIDKVVDEYGPEVLVNFTTGYKTVFFYTGLFNGEASVSDKKSAFLSYIANSIHKEESDGGNSGSINNQFIYTEKKNEDPRITDVEISIHNIGGGGTFSKLSALTKLDEIKVHLTPWMQTFNNKDNFAVMEASRDGFHPIYNYIAEENLKASAKAYVVENKKPSPLQQPRIEIVNQKKEGQIHLLSYLVTRFGEYVHIGSRLLSPDQDVPQQVEEIKAVREEIYDMEFRYREAPESEVIEYFSFDGLDDWNMKKYVQNDLTYLVYSSGNAKYAFSVYGEEVMEAYGLKNWIDGLPEADKVSLHRFKIIGL